jgi:hypothetical protein
MFSRSRNRWLAAAGRKSHDRPLAAWVGAATHDIGFEKDPRNGKVTREIDPAVNGERPYRQTLHGPDKPKNLTDSLPPAPVQDAKKRQRRRMPSEGRILAMLRQK